MNIIPSAKEANKPFKYRITKTSSGKETIKEGYCHTSDDAYSILEELKKCNPDVHFTISVKHKAMKV